MNEITSYANEVMSKTTDDFKYLSIVPGGKTSDTDKIGLVVAHKEFPINDNGILISPHSIFLDAIKIKDDGAVGIIIDRTGKLHDLPKEELFNCPTCGILTPIKLFDISVNQCYACKNLSATFDKYDKVS
jgi:hypothetical protein